MILNPYDLDARPGVKRGRTWRSYKAHFTAMLPEVHLVDAGYTSVGQVLAAADDHGVELVGPLRRTPVGRPATTTRST